MGTLNVANRTLAVMDNLPFLRSINNECIDLIAIDPPFATNETFTKPPKPPLTPAELDEERDLAAAHGVAHSEGIGETRVKDVWSWDADVHPGWKACIADDYPAVHAVIEAVEACAHENEAAYIAYMAIRLLECRRVLKPTGSIYVHCDDRANSYLRMLLDVIFGNQNFRNGIVWSYRTGGISKRWFPRKHDTILFYSKSDKYTFVPQYEKSYLAHEYGFANVSIEHDKHGSYRIVRTRDVWDIPALRGNQPETTRYPTQKPLALYERIIEASSNPGDVVLDIFAGCATTALAAERLGRQWLACDMAYRSWTMLKRRFFLNGVRLTGMTDTTIDALASVKKGKRFQQPQQWTTASVIGPGELPRRTDSNPEPYHDLQRVLAKSRSVQNANWSGLIPKEQAKQLLVDKFGPVCWGCGYEPRRPNGTLDLTLLEVDHIRARHPTDGVPGDDELYNLALLHRTCNGVKGNRLTLEELRHHNGENGWLYVEKDADLVDLVEAQDFAVREILQIGIQTALEQPSP